GALLDPGTAVDDEVAAKADRAQALALDREHDPRIALAVLPLLVSGHVPADDLVAVEADPDAAHLRAPVGVERDVVGERVGLDQLPGFGVQCRHRPSSFGGDETPPPDSRP